MASEGRWWPEELDEREAATLAGHRSRGRTGDGEPLVTHPDVLVVGGGIIGVATASALEAAGIGSVALVEGGHLGSGATGGAAGLLTPEPHWGLDPDPFVELGRESLVRWRVLDAEVPGGLGVIDLEWLGLLRSDEDPSQRSPRGELLDADEVAEHVPGLRLRTPAKGLRVVGQARVNPLRAVARLASHLRHVATDVQVSGATVHRGKVTAIETTAGRISPGAVVFATGNPPVLDGLEVAVPSDFVRGHMLLTEPVPVPFRGTVDPLATQLDDGRLLLGGTLDVGARDPRVDPATVQTLLDHLAGWSPALAGVRPARAWCCFRPHHPDDLPTIDRVPGVDNAWFTSGHYRTGVLMAPATAAVLTEWMTSGVAPARAEPFAAERLA